MVNTEKAGKCAVGESGSIILLVRDDRFIEQNRAPAEASGTPGRCRAMLNDRATGIGLARIAARLENGSLSNT